MMSWFCNLKPKLSIWNKTWYPKNGCTKNKFTWSAHRRKSFRSRISYLCKTNFRTSSKVLLQLWKTSCLRLRISAPNSSFYKKTKIFMALAKRTELRWRLILRCKLKAFNYRVTIQKKKKITNWASFWLKKKTLPWTVMHQCRTIKLPHRKRE